MTLEKRLQILLPPASVERLEKLLEVTEMSSYAEVIRNALRVYEWLVNEAARGKSFGIRSQGGEFEQVDVFAPKERADGEK